jgi:hypothetical protein
MEREHQDVVVFRTDIGDGIVLEFLLRNDSEWIVLRNGQQLATGSANGQIESGVKQYMALIRRGSERAPAHAADGIADN